MGKVAGGNEIREFLTTRRARITPDQAGLRAYGHRRRVSGLRREEVAMLAGISVEYYTQLERGGVSGASDDVVEAVVRALQGVSATDPRRGLILRGVISPALRLAVLDARIRGDTRAQTAAGLHA